ncbi:MAG: Uma2 family endonuclease [Planctomycetales bacterium]
MSTQLGEVAIEYPESDGEPMGETDLHRDWMFDIIERLRYRYRGQRVYVSGNLFLYYQEGNPRRSVCPDAFVVKDCDPGRRRIYLLWEEEKVPNVVFETTSSSTRREDTIWKPPVYETLGVPEYFLYDPTGDYLDPALRGYRLRDAGYQLIQPDADGRLMCEQLGILLGLEAGALVMWDSVTGEELPTETEAERKAREDSEAALEASEAVLEASEAARAAAEARAGAAEAELERFKKQLPPRSASPDV